MKKIYAEIIDINFDKITGFFGNELLRLVGVPIDGTYGRKLKELGIAKVAFFEWKDNDHGIPTERIYIGEVL